MGMGAGAVRCAVAVQHVPCGVLLWVRVRLCVRGLGMRSQCVHAIWARLMCAKLPKP